MPREQYGVLSASGLCPECGARRLRENVFQMIAHSGPNFDHWRRRMALSVGAIPVDDLIDLD